MKLTVFIFGGVVLAVAGVLQALVRPRKPKETPLERWVNGATVRAVFFLVVGTLAVLVGLGVIPIVPLG